MLSLGPPKIYIPVCKHSKDYLFVSGPCGYYLVSNGEIGKCPRLIEPSEDCKDGRKSKRPFGLQDQNLGE